MTEPLPPNPAYRRESQVERLYRGEPFDLLVIGGGATGIGVAVDAASRGFRVALCEQHDFGKGTSSRSTKLVHGGVRYLEQGNVTLVRHALHERGLLLQNAPHLVYPLPTLVPLYSLFDGPYYLLGLKAYDLLAGRLNIGRSRYLSRKRAVAAIPTLKRAGLRGGIRYLDAGFDDTRLLVNLLQTAIDEGAVCANYMPVEELKQQAGRVVGAVARDLETGATVDIYARAIVNAAGPFSDAVNQMASPHAPPRIRFSQGAHMVLDHSFLPSDSAMIVPKTRDGRVIFAIPWHGHTVVGTTDTPRDDAPLEPRPLSEEIDFLLETVADYLEHPPSRSDILSVFAGIRPLVSTDPTARTSKLARDHLVLVDDSGLISVLGGKWTTYRHMAEDAVNRAIEVADLPRLACRTRTLAIHGSEAPSMSGSLAIYGSDGASVAAITATNSQYADKLDGQLPYTVAEAVWAIRNEMARSVEDVLSRRIRMLLLNAAAAIRAAPRVAQLLADELGRDDAWVAAETARFEQLARQYLP